MNLKALAKPYTTPSGVVFYLLPFRNVLVDAAIIELERLVPRKDWTILHNTFALSEPLTVAIDFPDELTPEMEGLKLYWENRNGNAAHNYVNYMQLVSVDLYNEWWTAYNATRNRALDAPEELQVVPDENTDPELPAATTRRRKK